MIYSPIGLSQAFLQATLVHWYFLSTSKQFSPYSLSNCSNLTITMPPTKHRAIRKTKRKFYGNRHKVKPQCGNVGIASGSVTVSDKDRQAMPGPGPVVDAVNNTTTSASELKLANTDWTAFGESTSNFGMFDITVLCSVINSCAMCAVCKCGHLCLTENKQVKMGLSRQFILSCDDESCDFQTVFLVAEMQ